MANELEKGIEYVSQPELIVVFKEETQPTESGETIALQNEVEAGNINKILSKNKVTLQPVFGDSETEVQEAIASLDAEHAAQLQEMARYYQVVSDVDQDLEKMCGEFLKDESIETAYVKPGAVPSVYDVDDADVLEMQDVEHTQDENTTYEPAAMPNLVAKQKYLNPAPVGVDARYAWQFRGGKGDHVNVIDIEGGWNFAHKDLRQFQGGVISGTNTADLAWRNHGTAVIGEIGGDENSFGVTGISPRANTRAVSIFGNGSARAIRTAANSLRAGDIILLELHRPGPRFNFAGRQDQRGYIAIEWWPDDFLAIQYATFKGILVVEAAGNGGENLDSAIYNQRPSNFPSSWTNPFRRRGLRDSGAIIVGAGAPPAGTNGRNHGPDRSRLGFSNYGACVDAQGWGREVTTTGYGDAYSAGGTNELYTNTFSGTSSASPIVVGTLACLQGFLKGRGRLTVSPGRARHLLRTTGSPQTNAAGRPATQRIGNRPNLRQLIAKANHQNEWFGVQFRSELAPNQTRHYFTHSWPAHWIVNWDVIPTGPLSQNPQVEFKIRTARQSHFHLKYFIEVKNLSNQRVNFEARYKVLGW